MVVLAPLTALLEILCAILPAARRRLVWLVLILALVTLGLTPLTTEAGEWFYDRQPHPADILRTHAERGGWMIYFSAALVVVALLLVFLHLREGRSETGRGDFDHHHGLPNRRLRRSVPVGQRTVRDHRQVVPLRTHLVGAIVA